MIDSDGKLSLSEEKCRKNKQTIYKNPEQGNWLR